MAAINKHDLATIADRENKLFKGYKAMLMVCTGTGCVSAKAFNVRDVLQQEIDKRGLGSDFLVVATGCNGFCAQGPIIVVQPEGIFYQKITPRDVAQIIDEHLVGGKPVDRLLHADPVTVHEVVGQLVAGTNRVRVVDVDNLGLRIGQHILVDPRVVVPELTARRIHADLHF